MNKYPQLRKYLAVGIILLFIGTAIIPSSGQNVPMQSSSMTGGNTLYVGGSGPGNYTRIQSAINAAAEGDTIYVFNDSSPYKERLTINKKITLIGEDQATTFIDSPGYQYNDSVISIWANNVTISGFTIDCTVFGIIVMADDTFLSNLCIQGSGSSSILLLHAHYTFISQTTVKESQFGIDGSWFESSSNTTIEHCLILGTSTFAISMDSSGNIIRDNTIHSHFNGIIISGPQNQIYNNTVIGGCTGGILVYSIGNIIMGNLLNKTSIYLSSVIGNMIANNTVNGKPFILLTGVTNQTIDSAGQVFLVNCSRMTLKDLDIGFCYYGILLYKTSDSIVQNCTVFNSTEGIAIKSASHDLIKSSIMTGCGKAITINNGAYNTFENNKIVGGGIEFTSSSNNRIDNNSLNNSTIAISHGSHNIIDNNSFNKSTITISYGNYNVIQRNTEFDISLLGGNYNIITQNNFKRKIIRGAFVNSFHTNWTQNYWGQPLNHPKIIFGKLGWEFFLPYGPSFRITIPWINIDKHPAQQSYNISGMS